MKKQIKRFSKSTLAVVLTLCMLLSCVTVGIISTNAAQVDSDSTGDSVFMHYSSTDTGFSSNPTTVGIDSTVTLGSVAKGAFYVRVDNQSGNQKVDNWISSVDLGSNVYDDGTSENGGYKYRRLYFGKAMTNVKFTYSGGKLTVTTEPTYTITTSAGAGGSLEASPTRAAANEQVTLTITPERGKMLDQLTVSGGVTVSGSDNTRTFTMPAQNVTANATFKNATAYTVTANQVTTGEGKIRIAISGAGSATATTGGSASLAAYSGETLTVSTTADSGFTLDKLYVNGSQVTSPHTMTISGNVTISAEFVAGSSYTNEFMAKPDNTIVGNDNLYSNITATFYDYYCDNEIGNGTEKWYTGINQWADAWVGMNGSDYDSHRRRNNTLNAALRDYAYQNGVDYPLYFGSFLGWWNKNIGDYNTNDPENYNFYHIINDSNDISGQESLGGSSKALRGLAGWKDDGTIHNYSSTGTDKNGAAMALFDKAFLSGSNSQHKNE